MALAVVIVICLLGAVSSIVKTGDKDAPEKAYGITEAIMWVAFGVLAAIILS